MQGLKRKYHFSADYYCKVNQSFVFIKPTEKRLINLNLFAKNIPLTK